MERGDSISGDDIIEIQYPDKVYAYVTPTVVRWAREELKLSLEEAAKWTDIAKSTLERAEKETGILTMTQLFQLANSYKRAVSIFYFDLDEIPTSKPEETDFRKTSILGRDNAKVLIEQRRVSELSYFFAEFSDPKESIIGKFKPTEHNSVIAEWIETTLLIDEQELVKKTNNEVLKYWRSLIEKLGVLTFQFNKTGPTTTRGFSMSSTPFPIIVLNSKDTTHYSQVFTLIHELVHLLISQSGICDVVNERSSNFIEQKCEEVASMVLLPRERIASEFDTEEPLQSIFRQFTEMFKVSHSATLHALRNYKLISEKAFRNGFSLIREFKPRKKKSAKSEGNWLSSWKGAISDILHAETKSAVLSGRLTEVEARIGLGIAHRSFNSLLFEWKGIV